VLEVLYCTVCKSIFAAWFGGFFSLFEYWREMGKEIQIVQRYFSTFNSTVPIQVNLMFENTVFTQKVYKEM